MVFRTISRIAKGAPLHLDKLRSPLDNPRRHCEHRVFDAAAQVIARVIDSQAVMNCRPGIRSNRGLGSALRRCGRIAIRLVIGLFLVVMAAAGAIYWQSSAARSRESGASGAPLAQAELDAIRPQVTVFCGNCHSVPSPEGFPKNAWHEEVSKGFDFYTKSGRTDLNPPPLERVVTFFRNQAPERIVILPACDDPGPSPVLFRPTSSTIAWQSRQHESQIASLRWDRLSVGEPPVLLACDMRTGEIRAGLPTRNEFAFESLARLDNPARAVPVDLDADGRLDLVVADLGSHLPSDHDKGRVVWLRRTEQGTFETIVLQSGLGRVADVEPADFDGDGDVDLIVAEFGWHKTGRILLLENKPNASGIPQFELHVVDPRSGTIHVPVADLDGDGRPDFVALISQEHETVEAFINEGQNRFRRETIFTAGDPAFGSSGIELVDLDRDGDLDVLYTNGDTFDSFYLKPYHGIRWFENQGDGSFAVHHLAAMPGVHRALAGDFDGDGDLDIAACAMIPPNINGNQPLSDFDAVLWLEQTAPGKFARHSLQRAACHHSAMAL
ncbi:MAG: VCBS repeat-containing protein, partial [Planctomycetia bacterium]|nr:VCBS repeat-containing protein [Planctomycetia bacterium]